MNDYYREGTESSRIVVGFSIYESEPMISGWNGKISSFHCVVLDQEVSVCCIERTLYFNYNLSLLAYLELIQNSPLATNCIDSIARCDSNTSIVAIAI